MLDMPQRAASSPADDIRRSRLDLGLRTAGFSLIYAAAIVLSLTIAIGPNGIAIFWPASGVFLAALLLSKRSEWPLLIAALGVIHPLCTQMAGYELTASLGLGAAVIFETLVGALLTERFASESPPSMARSKDVVAVLAGGGLAACALSAICATLVLYDAKLGNFWLIWWNWYITDFISVIVVTPVFLTWMQPASPPSKNGSEVKPKVTFGKGRRAESAAMLATLALIVTCIFGADAVSPLTGFSYIIAYLLLFWAAGRLGPRISATASLLLAIMVIAFTFLDLGPYARGDHLGFPFTGVIEAQFYIAVVVSTSAIFSAIVSERQIAEMRRRSSQDQLRLFIENSPSTIYVKDESGRYLLINPSFTKLFAMTSEEVIGRTDEEIFPRDAGRAFRSNDLQVLTSGRAMQFEEQYADMHGVRTYLSVKFPFRNTAAGSSILCGVSTDITERKQMEEERTALFEAEQMARRQAERLNRIKDEFLWRLSHELRTPLNAILGWVYLMKSGTLNEQEQQEGYDVISRNVALQTRIIDDLLDISHLVAGHVHIKHERVDLEGLIESVLYSLHPAAAAKSIVLTRSIDPDLGLLWADRQRLRQVIWNLVANAVKFTPHGGRVDVSCKRRNAHCELIVHDCGIGIKEEHIPLVFQRFWQEDETTTREYGGLGLGLAIVKELVELHGGTVTATSSGKGQGTSIMVLLPLMSAAKTETIVKEPTRSEGKRDSLEGLSILVIDHDRQASEQMAQVLGQAGAHVTTAASTQDAMHMLHHEVHDIIVCDIDLPHEDGHSLIRMLRASTNVHLRRMPAVAVSGFANKEKRSMALEAGFQEHFAKTIEPVELIERLLRLADHAHLRFGS